MTNETEQGPEAPALQIISGNPTAEEVAAVTVVLAAATAGGDTARETRRRGWARPARRLGGGFSAATGWGRR